MSEFLIEDLWGPGPTQHSSRQIQNTTTDITAALPWAEAQAAIAEAAFAEKEIKLEFRQAKFEAFMKIENTCQVV